MVRLLSEAMSTAIAEVREVIVARIALLVDALAELDERVPVEPDVRDVAADGLVDQGLGRGPEGGSLGEPDQPFELGHEVEVAGWPADRRGG